MDTFADTGAIVGCILS